MDNKDKKRLTRAINDLGIDATKAMLFSFLQDEDFVMSYDEDRMLILASFDLWYNKGEYFSDTQCVMSFIEVNAFRKW